MTNPLKLSAGVKVTSPDAFTLHDPDAAVKVICFPGAKGSRSTEPGVTVPSTSESLAAMFGIITGVSSLVVPKSSTATGASFTCRTLMDRSKGMLLSSPSFTTIRTDLINVDGFSLVLE